MRATWVTVGEVDNTEYVVQHQDSGLGLALFTIVTDGKLITETAADIKTVEAEAIDHQKIGRTIIMVGYATFKLECLVKLLQDIANERCYDLLGKVGSQLSLEDIANVEDFIINVDQDLESIKDLRKG